MAFYESTNLLASPKADIKRLIRSIGQQFCQPYALESGPLKSALESENIPTLLVETDYSMEDAGQLATRIEAFVEMLKK